jgi:hypothetical protein
VYHVVDGKQRLTTLFEFVSDEFPVADDTKSTSQPGAYFSSLDADVKRAFWGYQFLVEYVPQDEPTLTAIFDRINRNVAKLTAQELRHAKLDGRFINAAERLAEWLSDVLPKNFPRFGTQSKKQMKDVEFVALLLLQIEEGPQGYSQIALDQAFNERDAEWELETEIETAFKAAVEAVRAILEHGQGDVLFNSRLRNQADFYSLVGAVDELLDEKRLPAPDVCAQRLSRFVQDVESEERRNAVPALAAYFDAARSASNDKGARETRKDVMVDVLLDQLPA